MEPALQQKLQNILTSQAVETFDKERQMYVVKEFEEGKLKEDPLNRLKTFAKRKLKGLYPALIKVFSPVHGPDPVITFLKERPAERFTTVNLGAGLHAYKDVINVDGTGYSSVHVACDLSSLPFESSSVDSIISVAVLEHVPNPAVHVSEFMRVLKPEGEVLCFIPFMQPFHASPFDYQRYTEPGLRELFRDFDIETVFVGAGPTSSFVWVLQEWLAMLLSFGSLRLYRILQVALLCLSPIKYLDFFLQHHPAASVLASGFFIRAKKSGSSSL